MFHGTNVGYTFESILIAADAFKRAKSTDPKALADAIRQTNITDRMMLGGPIKFNAKGQVEGNLLGLHAEPERRADAWCCPRAPPRRSRSSRRPTTRRPRQARRSPPDRAS